MGNLADQAKAFIKKGGVVNLSFGGAIDENDGEVDHVQRTCKDKSSLASLIVNALNMFNTHNAEFDIEGDYLTQDKGVATRLAEALAIVKQQIPDLHVSVIPALLEQLSDEFVGDLYSCHG